ncbi:cyclase family protein [Xanthovirga aplysinae]|uniref:cyclase family protein n=1 Tax=Xanthovirga aplysinae TaxID=2529853 RepID=UPI0012BB9D7E|nr:cyclase family protein [Xanthovirga aplysinae]MTI33317.1 cyclase family protein [Xanthovirga aplysinae]
MIEAITFSTGEKKYKALLHQPIDISIPLKSGRENPNCYWAESVQTEPIISGKFIGSVAQGGPVNHQKISLTPHGNGTHTECYGHISSDNNATLNRLLQNFHFLAELISVKPELTTSGDEVISLASIKGALKETEAEAIIIRTQPNEVGKKKKIWSGTNPPYFDPNAIEYLASIGINHLLTDLPSLDRELDGGKLNAHKAFWQFPESTRKNATITELIFVENHVKDGVYLLNLQITSLELDASPSKPILYPLTPI